MAKPPKNLKELLEEWDMWGFDSYKLEPDPVSEMARRLRKLDEHHRPTNTVGPDGLRCRCGLYRCGVRRILDGENSDG
jgi:hypothetical protein